MNVAQLVLKLCQLAILNFFCRPHSTVKIHYKIHLYYR